VCSVRPLGYFLRLPEMGGYAGTFGCKGSGGSIAFADSAHGLSSALTHNRLTAPPADVAAHVADRIRDAHSISA
jgi:CubicO group peptidase (beta-lactamase class C family)